MRRADKDPGMMKRRGIRRNLRLFGILLLLSWPAARSYADTPCTDCHNPAGVPVPHDAVCVDTTCAQSCHPKDLNQLRHSAGPGSPLTGERTSTCRSCHNAPFPGVYHPYRINVSAGTPTPPGIVDIDQGCGRCHGGGDDIGSNPPQQGAPYMTKTELGSFAGGMHADLPDATFGYTFSVPNTLIVNVDASGTRCLVGCDAYDWDWGDGAPHDTGVTATHTYAPGTYAITLAVTDDGVGTGAISQQVTVSEPDYPPVAAGVCAFDANTWTETVTDASTDDHGLAQVTVGWGDGSMLASDTTAPFGPFTRVYLNPAPASPGYYAVTHTAIDTQGQQNARICTAAPAWFTIGGTVKSRTGAGLGSASVSFKKGPLIVKTAYTAANGTFSAGSLKPGTYVLTVTKAGYTFAVPAATIGVGPSSPGNMITATGP